MKNLLPFIFIALTSFIVMSDSYEDEVRKRLGLLKKIPVVSMPGMAVSETSETEGRTGQVVYDQGCAACHTAGLAGAPMLGNLAQWEERTSKGLELLTSNAYSGYNAMPAKGMCMDCSETEIERSVQYMLDALTVIE
ncbi:MAG: cytochrome c5 family protein [SAR86 cluster bacterium]|uniref:Cytochrome c5 family protein n=1 Tax=SAR86 cluster bacterium TaxID=2030880 RepID=A0A520MU92_9GAMM|nr:MAG: cytochrome c5 family protein [SAR86 cluster bacterium]